MKKRVIALLLALGMLLTACGGGGAKTDDKKEGGDAAAGGQGKTYEIGVAIYNYNDNFMTLYREELSRYFEEKGKADGNIYNLDIQDGKNEQATQTEQLDNFISQGKNLIIANLVQPAASNALVAKAQAANIPIVFINREPSEDDMKIWPGKTTYVGADATQSGTYQGEIIASLPDKGDLNGDGKVSYIMLMGDTANVDAQQRTEFSVKALEAAIPVEALAEPYLGNWDTAKGQEFTASALAQFGDSLELVFSNNDGMALGADTAIKAAGRKVGENIYLVGVDAIDSALELLRNGDLTGTVLNDHINQARTAADVAIKMLNGEDASTYYWIDYVKITDPAFDPAKDIQPVEPKVENLE